MIAKVISSTNIGIDSHIVNVEVDISPGLPQFNTVGLPDAVVKESKDRIRAAIRNSGYTFPENRVTVNLAPADIRKEGTSFDLPIAAGILAAQEIIGQYDLRSCMIMGELSLDGAIKPINGTLSASMQCRQTGVKTIIVPRENSGEAALVDGVEVIPADFLSDVVEYLNGRKEICPLRVDISGVFQRSLQYPHDFSEVNGQEQAKRAIEVAAAGGHNLLMIGPPGSGKTMLAQRLPTILPEMCFDEAIETTRVFSVAGLRNRDAIIGTRPFRSPHHTISDAGLVGGGHFPRPGEVSLAHNGVLFLDELPEFRRNVLEVLRQPLEDGVVTITRSALTATYPARFMLIAAMNPCPCGHYTDPQRPCHCSPQQIRHYRSRISGPLLDRIDIHIEVPAVRYRELARREPGETSSAIRERINTARIVQRGRFDGRGTLFNARMSAREIKAFCPLAPDSMKLLEMAVDKLGLSARAFNRIVKVARTIADLEQSRDIRSSHVAEAIQYRSLDRRVI